MNLDKVALYVANSNYSNLEAFCQRLEGDANFKIIQINGLKRNKTVLKPSKSSLIDWSDIDPKNSSSDQTIAQALYECETMVMFVHPADYDQVVLLTAKFIESAQKAEVKRFIWIAPAGGENRALGQQLAAAEKLVKNSGMITLVVRHAPLFSEILAHKQELKFRRTLSFPFGDKALPWIAPESVAQVAYTWLINGEKHTSGIIAGPDNLTGNELAEKLTQVLQDHVDSHTYAQAQFAGIDRDLSGEIDLEELFPYLSELGYSRDEAETIFADTDTDKSGSIDFEEFIDGLEEHLEQILTEVPTEVHYLNIPKLAALHDLTKIGMDQVTAKAQLDLMEELTSTNDHLKSSPELTQYLGESDQSFADWVSQYALELINVHIIPQQGISTVIEGELSGQPALFTRLLKSNDRLLVGEHTLDGKILELSWANQDLSEAEVVPYEAENGSERVLTFCNNKIAQISVRGSWLGRRRGRC